MGKPMLFPDELSCCFPRPTPSSTSITNLPQVQGHGQAIPPGAVQACNSNLPQMQGHGQAIPPGAIQACITNLPQVQGHGHEAIPPGAVQALNKASAAASTIGIKTLPPEPLLDPQEPVSGPSSPIGEGSNATRTSPPSSPSGPCTRSRSVIDNPPADYVPQQRKITVVHVDYEDQGTHALKVTDTIPVISLKQYDEAFGATCVDEAALQATSSAEVASEAAPNASPLPTQPGSRRVRVRRKHKDGQETVKAFGSCTAAARFLQLPRSKYSYITMAARGKMQSVYGWMVEYMDDAPSPAWCDEATSGQGGMDVTSEGRVQGKKRAPLPSEARPGKRARKGVTRRGLKLTMKKKKRIKKKKTRKALEEEERKREANKPMPVAVFRTISDTPPTYGRPRLELQPQYLTYEPIPKDALNRQVEYDVDDEDQAWLVLVNAERLACGQPVLTQSAFEFVMDRMEKICFDLISRNPSKYAVREEQVMDEDAVCAVCLNGDCENVNQIIFCDACDLE